jgi:simple sugar transport system ATP-binding protein
MVDMARATDQIKVLAAQYGLHVIPNARVDSVPVGMRQRVEILKALYRGADVLILDEPTAVLTPGETRDLFAALRALARQGKTVIFITHRLREVRAISDRVTVMRGGRVMETLPTATADEWTLARLMVGREIPGTVERPPARPGEPVLQVRDLTCLAPSGKAALDAVSLEVRAGEIVGIAGVEGNGQTELAEVLAGLRPAASGTATVQGCSILGGDPRHARAAGVAHIPEDRLANGTALSATVGENLIVDRFDRAPFTRGGLLRPREIVRHARALITQFGIVASGSEAPLSALSGGNVQKVVVARELSAGPRLLIAVQPTRGVDIGATEFIHSQLITGRSAGLAILLISADLQEVLRLADRLLVMHDGHIVARFDDPGTVTEDELGLYMAGVRRQTDVAVQA